MKKDIWLFDADADTVIHIYPDADGLMMDTYLADEDLVSETRDEGNDDLIIKVEGREWVCQYSHALYETKLDK